MADPTTTLRLIESVLNRHPDVEFCACPGCSGKVRKASKYFRCDYCGYEGAPLAKPCQCGDPNCFTDQPLSGCDHGFLFCPVCGDGDYLELETRLKDIRKLVREALF